MDENEVVAVESAWPIVGMGAAGVMLIAVMAFGSHIGPLSPLPLPVVILGMLIGVIPAALVCTAVFLAYNVLTLGFNMAKVTGPALCITGLMIATIGCLSLLLYSINWRVRDVHVVASTVNAWAVFNVLLALITIGLFVFSIRRQTPEFLVGTHIAMFVWLYTYAFPWLGEMAL